MSWKLVARAQKLKAGSPSKKAVLVALASFADDDGGSCFPGQGLIEQMTELSVDTIQRALKALEDDGLISRTKRAQHRGQWASWAYQISLPLDADQAAPCGPVAADQTAPCGSVGGNNQAAPCGTDQAAQCGTVEADQAAPCGVTRPHLAASPGRKVRPYSSIEPKSYLSRASAPSNADALGLLGAALTARLGPDKFRSWFGKAQFGEATDDAVTIELPSPFIANYVKQNFEHELLACCREQRPAVARVNVIVVQAA